MGIPRLALHDCNFPMWELWKEFVCWKKSAAHKVRQQYSCRRRGSSLREPNSGVGEDNTSPPITADAFSHMIIHNATSALYLAFWSFTYDGVAQTDGMKDWWITAVPLIDSMAACRLNRDYQRHRVYVLWYMALSHFIRKYCVKGQRRRHLDYILASRHHGWSSRGATPLQVIMIPALTDNMKCNLRRPACKAKK